MKFIRIKKSIWNCKRCFVHHFLNYFFTLNSFDVYWTDPNRAGEVDNSSRPLNATFHNLYSVSYKIVKGLIKSDFQANNPNELEWNDVNQMLDSDYGDLFDVSINK